MDNRQKEQDNPENKNLQKSKEEKWKECVLSQLNNNHLKTKNITTLFQEALSKQHESGIPKNWAIIATAAMEENNNPQARKYKIDTLISVINNKSPGYALTLKQKEQLEYLKYDLSQLPNKYKNRTKNWGPWVVSLIAEVPGKNLELALELSQCADQDMQIILKKILEVKKKAEANASTHLLPDLDDMLVGVWTHLYNMYKPKQTSGVDHSHREKRF